MAPTTLTRTHTLVLGVCLGTFASWAWRRLRSTMLTALTARPPPAEPFAMEKRLSLVGRARRSAPLRGLIPLLKLEGMVPMSGGLPGAENFPIKRYEIETKEGEIIRLEGALADKAQQYMHDVTPGLGTIGYLPLLQWIRTHVQTQHAPPYDGWTCCVSTGNADGFQRAWETVLDPGDTLLVEELNFAFSTSQLCAWTGGRGLHVEPCRVGRGGIDVLALEELLATWSTRRAGLRFPKALFTIPCMQNPTTTDLDEASVKRIYTIAARFGLIIIEVRRVPHEK